VVVASSQVAARISPAQDRTIVVNDAPERGMTHSLRLADHAIPKDDAVAVLLADKPLVTGDLVARISAALEAGADVAFPERDGVPGHPVGFSAQARVLIDALPDGDTLQKLRDDPRLRRCPIRLDDRGAYVDIDTPDDYRRLQGTEGAIQNPG
jgi:molybdenum cofactor cytidylyltransferase